MRWDSLFNDLEAQLEEQEHAQLREEIAENTRIERATAELLPTLFGCHGLEMTLRLAGGTEVRAQLGPCANDYICMENARSQWVIRRPAIQSIALPARSRPAPGHSTESRTAPFATVVRGLLRDRARCSIYGLHGAELATGTLMQVAKDFVRIAVHPSDEYARPERISAQLLIPVESIGWVETAVLA